MYARNKRKKSPNITTEEPRAVISNFRATHKETLDLVVNMDEYWEWLGKRLTRDEVVEIRKVTNRDGFVDYCKEHAISFIFE